MKLLVSKEDGKDLSLELDTHLEGVHFVVN
jgi:hypothetical protein